jgi:TPR repeat protein
MKVAILLFALSVPALADLAAGERALKNANYSTALKEFMPLAKQGNARAQFNLGVMFDHGQGVPQDDKEAARWFRLAAEQGNQYAQLILAAKQGNVSSQYTLGQMYYEGREEGQGLPQDYKEAARWHRLAAEQGFAYAQLNLGFMYHDGEGVPLDFKEAARWFRLAAEQGDTDGQYDLGTAYLLGQGVAQDDIQAYKWFSLASAIDRGGTSAKAIHMRDYLAPQMTLKQLADAQRLAREWKPTTGTKR